MYEPVIRLLIRDFSWITRKDGSNWHQALQTLSERYGSDGGRLTFAAIDGTCGREQLAEMLVFYAASYAQRGEIAIEQDRHRVEYRRWSPSEDKSFVAYLPVPLSRLDLLEDEDWLFRADDEDRASAAIMHTALMQLAEIYQAYARLTEDNPPQVLMLDHSLSSILLSNDVMDLVRSPADGETRALGWIGAHISEWGRTFETTDGLVGHSHPMNERLGVPSARMNAIAEHVVALITEHWTIGDMGERNPGKAVAVADLANCFRGDTQAIRDRVQKSSRRFRAFELAGDEIVPISSSNRTLKERWFDLRRLFESTCNALFRERRIDALQLQYPSDGQRRGIRWMDAMDIKFLAGLGLRLLIELCWKKRVMLLGFVKDSASRYFTRNYLGVMSELGKSVASDFSEPHGSDRLIFEEAPFIDEALEEPWGTVEFDAIFMTLRALLGEQGRIEIKGVKGDVLSPSDGLFARSLVQMFLKRNPEKNRPLRGHVLLLDRLTDPQLDSNRRLSEPIETRESRVNPVLFEDNTVLNLGQDAAMLVAYLLTKNCFPEAIGQPDPLHRADMGAKALGRRLNGLVRNSVDRLRSEPLNWPFRDNRAEYGG